MLVSDGGGVVSAARRPVVGADRVARFLAGIGSRIAEDTSMDEQEVNGLPCLVVRTGGVVTQVFSFDVAGDRVQGLQIVGNPGKLSHLR